MTRRHPHRDLAPALAALPETSRRDVLRTMAATLALGAAGCDGPPDDMAVPYARTPEELVPGRPLFYATAVTMSGYARPVIAECHMGRPTRLDGNGRHPLGSGAADPFMQAAVLDLYDPDRPALPRLNGREVPWATADVELDALAARLGETAGAGCRLLTGCVTSPTLLRQIDAFLERFPGAVRHVWEPALPVEAHAAGRLAFGRPVALHPQLAEAVSIVCLGADPLGPGPAQVPNGARWAARRAAIRSGALAPGPLMVAEPAPTLTGALADARLPVPPSRLPVLVEVLDRLLTPGAGDAGADLSEEERTWIRRAAAALRADPGRTLLLAGEDLPPAAQAMALRINDRLGNLGRTLIVTEEAGTPLDEPGRSLPDLVRAVRQEDVETLLILGANPLHAAPGPLDMPGVLAALPRIVVFGERLDETAEAATLFVPTAHVLESWSDARDLDGTATIIQPTIRPLADRPTLHQAMARILRDPRPAREIVRGTWAARWPGRDGDAAWEEALSLGYVPGTALPPLELTVGDLPEPIRTDDDGGDGLELIIRPDPTVWDGTWANNAWLQELPKPLTRLTWTNAVTLAPALMAELGLEDGSLVEVALTDGAAVVGPALALPGQDRRTVALSLGYGRTAAGRNGTGIGYNAWAVTPADGQRRATGVRLRPLGQRIELPLAQQEGSMHGHDLARTVSLTDPAVQHPASAPPPPSLHPDWDYPVHRWAMAVDLDSCIGCGACVVACQAENSIPTVGAEEAKRGRLMHWIRVERYWTGEPETESARFLPVMCVHCEKAPCEVGCPVNATVHGPDGLNQMIYNRCIGTRTCAAFCPYEVRRFNWFDYADLDHAEAPAQRNPDVTVRARGVMEKCTYCTQRIRAAEIQAGIEGRPPATDEVTTACASACPSAALIFGDLNDPDSRVAALHREGRAYHLLRELGTRPRTFHLARLALDTPPTEGKA